MTSTNHITARPLALVAWFGLSLVGVACAAPVEAPGPDEPLPESLGEYGLYRGDEADDVADWAAAYVPRYPLWTNGSRKDRFLVIPGSDAGAFLEGNGDASNLPVGSLLFKTFSYPDPDGHRWRPIETRVLRRSVGGWEYAVYVWGDTGALRYREGRPLDVEVSLDGETFEHTVPTERQCPTCHGTSEVPVLGLTPLQLGHEDLPSGADARTREVLGYVVGNCVHCHQGGNGAFSLRPNEFVQQTVGVDTRTHLFPPGLRIAPGNPSRSLLLRALAQDDPDVPPMPPLGVQRVDRQAVLRLTEWIRQLH